MSKPMGRKPVEINDGQLKTICKLKPTLKDVANYFECSEDTIERHIRKNHEMTFAEYRAQKMVHTRFDLIQTAIGKALKGDNSMLIFCLKNLCGWRDKFEEYLDEESEEKKNSLKYMSMSTQELVVTARDYIKSIEASKGIDDKDTPITTK